MSRRLYSTSCDDDGNLTIELMKPTETHLKRAASILNNLARGIPSIAEDAGAAAEKIEAVIEACDATIDTDLIEDDDEEELDDGEELDFADVAGHSAIA